MEWLSKVLEWLSKPGPIPAATVALASAVILILSLCLSPDAQAALGLSEFQGIIRILAVIGLSLSGSHLAVYAVARKWDRMKGDREQAQVEQQRISRLHDLTDGERELLKAYLQNDSRTRSHRNDDAATPALETDGILAYVKDGGFDTSLYSIDPLAWDYLREHPELVGLEED